VHVFAVLPFARKDGLSKLEGLHAYCFMSLSARWQHIFKIQRHDRLKLLAFYLQLSRYGSWISEDV